MNWLFENYLKLYSFYLTTNKRTAKGTYKAFAKNLSYSNCFITVFGTTATVCFLLVYLTRINVESSTLIIILGVIGLLNSILAINFRNRYSQEILELDEHPNELSLDTLTLNLIQIASGAFPIISISLLYNLILGQPIIW